jgi:MoaA/NifB/PqqE/SkfB family radical SAM enzyme
MLKQDFFRQTIDDIHRELLYLIFYFQGEPYLNPDFLDMVKYAAKKNIYTATSTNAHYLNDENADKIREIIKSRSGDDYDPEETLENLIDEYDDDYDIRGAIDTAHSDTASSEFYDYVISELKSALEEYGKVLELNDEGAVIKIDLNTVIDAMGVDETDLDEAFENCKDDPACVFNELLGEYYDNPRFSLDERWTPSIDDDEFNSILKDILGEIM